MRFSFLCILAILFLREIVSSTLEVCINEVHICSLSNEVPDPLCEVFMNGVFAFSTSYCQNSYYCTYSDACSSIGVSKFNYYFDFWLWDYDYTSGNTNYGDLLTTYTTGIIDSNGTETYYMYQNDGGCYNYVKVTYTLTSSSTTSNPTNKPTNKPTISPTNKPTISPTSKPTISPTNKPTINPTNKPMIDPTNKPTINPTNNPMINPTDNSMINSTNNLTISSPNKPTMYPTNNLVIATLFIKPTTISESSEISYEKSAIKSSNSFIRTLAIVFACIFLFFALCATIHKKQYDFLRWKICGFKASDDSDCLAILEFGLQSFALIMDIRFNVLLYKLNQYGLAVSSTIFIILPYIASLLGISNLRNKYNTQQNFSVWMDRYSNYLILSVIVSGAAAPAIFLFSSRIFGKKLFSLSISKNEFNDLLLLGFCLTIARDIPQLIIQIIYLSKYFTINILLMFITIFSLIWVGTSFYIKKGQSATSQDIIVILKYHSDNKSNTNNQIKALEYHSGNRQKFGKIISQYTKIERSNIHISDISVMRGQIKAAIAIKTFGHSTTDQSDTQDYRNMLESYKNGSLLKTFTTFFEVGEFQNCLLEITPDKKDVDKDQDKKDVDKDQDKKDADKDQDKKDVDKDQDKKDVDKDQDKKAVDKDQNKKDVDENVDEENGKEDNEYTKDIHKDEELEEIQDLSANIPPNSNQRAGSYQRTNSHSDSKSSGMPIILCVPGNLDNFISKKQDSKPVFNPFDTDGTYLPQKYIGKKEISIERAKVQISQNNKEQNNMTKQ